MKTIDSLSDIDKYNHLNFVPLTEKDFHLLLDWLNKPHVRTFYQPEAISLSKIKQKYKNRLFLNSSVRCYITMFKQIPIGYIQTYLIDDHPDFARVIGITKGATIDFYIGETSYLQKGLGWLIELKFLKEILFTIFPVQKCYICHKKANANASKTSRKAGFHYIKDAVEENKSNEILLISKKEVVQRTNYLIDSNK